MVENSSLARGFMVRTVRAGRRRLGFLMTASLLTSGCSTIDNFGGRATTVNAAASDSKSRSIMMNVMRAAYREPLQFSDVSTVAGTGQITGSLGPSAPIKISPTSAARVLDFGPSVGATGTNQFNITNLNTQEFYYGLQSPISLQQIANLIDAGYDPTLVLFLTVSELDVTTIKFDKNGKPFKTYVTIRNSTDSADDFATTYNALYAMVEMGFSEQASDGDPYGPAMTGKEVQNSRMVAAIQAAAGADLTLKKNKNGTFQFYKKGGFTTCFDLTKAPLLESQKTYLATLGLGKLKTYRSFSDAERFSETRDLTLAYFKKDGKWAAVPGTSMTIPKEKLCGTKTDTAAEDDDDDMKPSFKLKMRSVEGIFQFLGNIARRQNGIGAGVSRDPLNVGAGFAFRVQEGTLESPRLQVPFHDKNYYIKGDLDGENDQTTQVLQILTDLLALQSSAKNIPSPGLITVIGR